MPAYWGAVILKYAYYFFIIAVGIAIVLQYISIIFVAINK